MTGPTRTPDADPTPSRSPLFLPAAPPTSPPTASTDPTPSPSPDRQPPLSDLYDVPDASGPGSDAPSGTRSTGSPARSSKIAGLRATMRRAIRTAGGIVDALATRRDPADAGVFLPDDEDVEGIAVPLANIAGRRAPAAVSDNPDLIDLSAIALALVGYVTKSLAARAAADPGEYVAGLDGLGAE